METVAEIQIETERDTGGDRQRQTQIDIIAVFFYILWLK